MIALLLQVPVPWLIGSLLITAVATRAGMQILPLPGVIEGWMRVAIGVSLGPAVAASFQSSSADFAVALGAALLATVVTVVAGMRWFQHRCDLPRASAYLAAMPGGLSMLMALGSEMDDRARVVLVHTVRVVIVVVFISALARVLGVPAQPHPIIASFTWGPVSSLFGLLMLIVANYIVAWKINIAGGHVIIPMFTTALLIGIFDLKLQSPAIVQTLAFLVFGINLGCEIARQPARSNLRLSLASLIFTMAAMGFVAALALTLTQFTSRVFLVLFLALAPGGIAEISLVALALGLDAGLVALVHSCRFVFIVLAGSVGLQYFINKRR